MTEFLLHFIVMIQGPLYFIGMHVFQISQFLIFFNCLKFILLFTPLHEMNLWLFVVEHFPAHFYSHILLRISPWINNFEKDENVKVTHILLKIPLFVHYHIQVVFSYLSKANFPVGCNIAKMCVFVPTKIYSLAWLFDGRLYEGKSAFYLERVLTHLYFLFYTTL